MLTVVAGESIYSLTRTKGDIKDVVEVRQPVAIASLQLANALDSANASLGFYLTRGEEIHQQNYDMALTALSDGITALKAMPAVINSEETATLVASIEGISDARNWVLGPQARYLIVLGPGRLVQFLDPRSGELMLELPYPRELVRFVATADDLLLSVDVAGDILVWRLSDAQRGDLDPQLVGITVDPLSVSIAGDGSVVAYEAANSHVIVRDVVDDVIALSARNHDGSG